MGNYDETIIIHDRVELTIKRGETPRGYARTYLFIDGHRLGTINEERWKFLKLLYKECV